jgi:3-oxoacyl-[acyl-carrier protein] reductase
MTAIAEHEGISREAVEERVAPATILKRLPRLAEIGAAATLMASDRASAATAIVMNVTCGAVVD